MELHSLFIEFVSIALDDLDGILRTLAQAGPQSVTKIIRCKNRLPIHDPDGSFSACRDAEPAAIASILIDPYDFAYHVFPLSEKVVPEIIKPAAQHQPAAGVGHDLADL
jgi:hypothetical protein